MLAARLMGWRSTGMGNRMRRWVAGAFILLVLAVPGCAQTPGAAEPAVSPAVQDPDLPAGWRWESYGGVEVGIPGDWGWGNGSQRLSQWCVATPEQIAKPIVGRPGGTTLAGCGVAGKGRPDTLIANTGSVVAFDRTTAGPGAEEHGDQSAVRLDGVEVTVNAPPELRHRIVATIRRVAEVDSFGCPTTHSISDRPDQRPAKPASLSDVTSVSACKYPVGHSSAPKPRLISSLRLDGAAADQAIRAVAEAPRGGGPDNPDQCMPSVSYGDDVIVLLVRSAAGRTEIVLRYSGCDHNGFDDGISVRKLTVEAVAPFIARSNGMYGGFSGGPEKLAVLDPEAARQMPSSAPVPNPATS